ncbi:MAG: ferredoxin [Pirellulales bacterium]
MIKSFKFMALALAVLYSSQLYAGCGLLRRGGCSDPCTAGACAGVAFHQGSCGGCATMGGVVADYSPSMMYHSNVGAVQCENYVPSSYVQSGYVQSSVVQVQEPAPMVYSQPAISAATIQRADLMDCGPVASYQVVMQTEYVAEKQFVPFTEYKDEVRYRSKTVSRQVPVEVKDFRTKTVLIPKTETKTVDYNVLVPHQQEKIVQVTESVPVWNEVQETYTVKVPNLVDVVEEYRIRVPLLRDEAFTYTVQVPQTHTEQKIQRVTNAVPVTKTRTVQVPRPVAKTQMVTRDLGHWELRVEEVASSLGYTTTAAPSISIGGCGTGTTYVSNGCGAAQPTYTYSGCGRQAVSSSCGSCGRRTACGGCGQAAGCGQCGCGQAIVAGSGPAACGTISGVEMGCGVASATATTTITRRVWVPNVVTEEVSVVENVMESKEIAYTAFEQQTTEVPYECVMVVYVPEQRTGTRKVVDYVDETRSRTRKVVQYKDESRVRSRKELSYKQQVRDQKIPFVSYTTEKRTKDVSFTVNVPETQVEPFTTTRYDTVQEEMTEQYTVKVPVTNYREQIVQVAKIVPKLVPITINPCQEVVSPTTISYGTSVGCGSPVPAATGCGCGTPTLAPLPPPCR